MKTPTLKAASERSPVQVEVTQRPTTSNAKTSPMPNTPSPGAPRPAAPMGKTTPPLPPADDVARISVRNLEAGYANHKVLKTINMDVPPRSVTAIMGPSGCG